MEEIKLQPKVSADDILTWTKNQVESKKIIDREVWLDIAFKLNLLRLDEAQLFNQMSQKVAIKKLEILKNQTKRNVAAAELEIETTDEYRFMKDQEDKLYTLDEFVRVAKKNSDLSF